MHHQQGISNPESFSFSCAPPGFQAAHAVSIYYSCATRQNADAAILQNVSLGCDTCRRGPLLTLAVLKRVAQPAAVAKSTSQRQGRHRALPSYPGRDLLPGLSGFPSQVGRDALDTWLSEAQFRIDGERVHNNFNRVNRVKDGRYRGEKRRSMPSSKFSIMTTSQDTNIVSNTPHSVRWVVHQRIHQRDCL